MGLKNQSTSTPNIQDLLEAIEQASLMLVEHYPGLRDEQRARPTMALLNLVKVVVSDLLAERKKRRRAEKDISEWVQLAKSQREWFSENGDFGVNSPNCPSMAAIVESEKLLGRSVEWLRRDGQLTTEIVP